MADLYREVESLDRQARANCAALPCVCDIGSVMPYSKPIGIIKPVPIEADVNNARR